MKKRLLYIGVLLPMALFFNDCAKIEPLPDVAQPIVRRYPQAETFAVGDTSYTVGASKDYEQDSEVIFKLTAESNSLLSKMFVTTTSDSKSKLSRVLRTEPADAIDTSGNFIKKLNNVVVYYAFHIHPSVPILSTASVTFSFENEQKYVGTNSQIFTIIKKGSTQGKRLTVIDLPWASRYKAGIGSQRNLDLMDQSYRSTVDFMPARGPFFSIEMRGDIWRSVDAIQAADKIDLVGLVPMSPRTNDPKIIYNEGTLAGPFYYLVSPSDTTLLMHKYAGADIARIQLRFGKTGDQVDITVKGVTRRATFASSVTTTCTNFVNAHKAAYAAVGINLTNIHHTIGSGASDNLYFRAINDNDPGFDMPTTCITLGTGNMIGWDWLPKRDEFPYFTMAFPYDYNANIAMRLAVRGMVKQVSSMGKSLITAYYKRLDNSTGPDKLSADEFELLTHDNEFDKYLGPCLAEAKTYGGPVKLGREVWGFVLSDGRRGLIRTSPTTDIADNTNTATPAIETVLLPNRLGLATLWCKIKVSE